MDYQFKTSPYKHQLSALKDASDKENWAFFMDMGTGKTKTTIDNLGILFQEGKIESALIVAPKSVYAMWEKEIENHLSEKIDRIVQVWNLTKKPTIDLIHHRALGIFNIMLMNVEAFSTTNGVTAAKYFFKHHPKAAFIIDEATTIKNQKAKRTKSILKLSTEAKFRRILTGSPITKSPLDLFTQCKFLSPKLLGYDSFYTFRARYAEMHTIQMGAHTQVMIPKFYKNLEELEQRIKTFSTRVRKEDCLDIPPKIYEQRKIQLKGKQAEVYKRLKQNAITILNDSTVSFSNQLTEILKLHQVANGFVKNDDGEIEIFNNPKLDELMTVLDEINGKAIIWANYIHNIKEIAEAIEKEYGKGSYVTMYGATSVEDRKQVCEDFQTNDKVRFFIGNPTVGGYGLTLHAASYVIYYSNNYNLEVRLQSEDRAHRIGQTKNVLYIDIIAEDTVDEKIVSALDRKLTLSAKTLGEEIKTWLK
jgi:SNF2 family DNA or RNA helicase